MNNRMIRHSTIFLAIVWATTAFAQESTTQVDDSCKLPPWHCGVSEEDRLCATALYESGKRDLGDFLFRAAAEKYHQALTCWDHPGIQYGLAVALKNLDRPLQAYKAVVQALRYGKQGLHAEEYGRAVEIKQQIESRTVELEIHRDPIDAAITIDGKPVLPRQDDGDESIIRIRVLPGERELRARRDDYVDGHKHSILKPGMSATIGIALVPRDKMTLEVRRWARWKPWSIVGVGAGSLTTGLFFQQRANNSRSEYRHRFSRECPIGCIPNDLSQDLHDIDTRSQRQRVMTLSAYAVAASALLAGTTLLYMNQKRTVSNPSIGDSIRIQLLPTSTPNANLTLTGVSLSVGLNLP